VAVPSRDQDDNGATIFIASVDHSQKLLTGTNLGVDVECWWTVRCVDMSALSATGYTTLIYIKTPSGVTSLANILLWLRLSTIILINSNVTPMSIPNLPIILKERDTSKYTDPLKVDQ
jgi:hypothetical protein